MLENQKYIYGYDCLHNVMKIHCIVTCSILKEDYIMGHKLLSVVKLALRACMRVCVCVCAYIWIVKI